MQKDQPSPLFDKNNTEHYPVLISLVLFYRLPLPWLIGSLINIPHPYVPVDAKGLLCSIILLFAMLITTITSIALFKWRLSKGLGLFMIVLYMGFVAVSILLTLGVVPCINIKFS